MELNVYITEQEKGMLIQALTALQYQTVDVANGLERTYGPADGRVREAWADALRKQEKISALRKKLGI